MPKKKASNLLAPIVGPLLEPPIQGDVDGSQGGTGLAHAEPPVYTLPVPLPLPILIQATGSGDSVTLAPMSATGGATVRVQYSPMSIIERLTVIIDGAAGWGVPRIAEKNGVVTGVVDFPIPATSIGVNIGNANKTCSFQYTVSRPGSVVPSDLLTVTVTPIPQGNLPWPLIDGIDTGGTLNVTGFGTATRLSLAAYPFQVANTQLIWLTYKGTNSSNQAVELEPWTAANNPHSGAWSQNPDNHAWFKALKHGTRLTIEVRIAFDRVDNKANAVLLRTTVYTVANQ